MGVAEWHIQTTEKPSHTVIDCKNLPLMEKFCQAALLQKIKATTSRFDRITTTVIIVYKKLTG
jgi:hypothetical protein